MLEIPESLDFADAAPLTTALLTEYGALRRAGLRQDDTVLITAATSGIALVGAQVAKVLGAATVIGTTRNAASEALLRGVGIDHVLIDGTDSDIGVLTRALTGGDGADLVLDYIGGGSIRTAISAARSGGSVVSVGRLAGSTAELDLFELAAQRVTLRSVSYGFNPPRVIGDLLAGVKADVLDAVAVKRVRAIVDSEFAFADAAQAFDRLRNGGTRGKIVLHVG